MSVILLVAAMAALSGAVALGVYKQRTRERELASEVAELGDKQHALLLRLAEVAVLVEAQRGSSAESLAPAASLPRFSFGVAAAKRHRHGAQERSLPYYHEGARSSSTIAYLEYVSSR